MLQEIKRGTWTMLVSAAALAVGGCAGENKNAEAGSAEQKWQSLEQTANKPSNTGWTKLVPVGGDAQRPFQWVREKEQNDKQAARRKLDEATAAMNGPVPAKAYEQALASVALRLAKDLAATPEVIQQQNGLGRQVLIVAPIESKLRSHNEALDAAMSGLVAKLSNTDAVRSAFVILAHDQSRAETALDAARAAKFWEVEDPNLPGQGNARLVKYHPDAIHKLDGKLFKIDELSKHRFIIKVVVNIWHPRSGALKRAYELNYQYHFDPDLMEWISAEEDERLTKGESAT